MLASLRSRVSLSIGQVAGSGIVGSQTECLQWMDTAQLPFEGLYSVSMALRILWPAVGIISLDWLEIGCCFNLAYLTNKEILVAVPSLLCPFPGEHGWPVWADHDWEPAETTVWPGGSGDLQVVRVSGQRAETRTSSCNVSQPRKGTLPSQIRECESPSWVPASRQLGLHVGYWFIVLGEIQALSCHLGMEDADLHFRPPIILTSYYAVFQIT